MSVNCMYVCMYACMYICMYICMYKYMYVHICMYVCMYVCMHVCMCNSYTHTNECHWFHCLCLPPSCFLKYTLNNTYMSMYVCMYDYQRVYEQVSTSTRVYGMWVRVYECMVCEYMSAWDMSISARVMWVYECMSNMSVWVSERMSIWKYAYVSMWVYEYMIVRVYEYMSTWVTEVWIPEFWTWGCCCCLSLD